MTAPVTIHDLQHPDSPQVVAALTVKCRVCHAEKGTFCRPVGQGKRMAALVHFDRSAKALKVGQ